MKDNNLVDAANQMVMLARKSLLFFGAIFTIIALLGITIDIVVASVSGGDLLKYHQTAIERFDELQRLLYSAAGEALLLAMPGGLLSMLWMAMYTSRLFKLSV
ncbi:hypothetical protein CH373_06170 [Leptospira perolatii]|uniref:Uncharacterized protein n=1 Tax=Leptospira perolatii TaxID=2023191 RepID=A0A2M9ZP49_9LEPT|nr:hypothetical protein [Leptospira perolatii]PJZ70853.1 hypothetical protein CH360_04900 [Leptospira perolatii]PJZ73749.1 hypothetical protein CH373_06170 [Leptospira perolatii]